MGHGRQKNQIFNISQPRNRRTKDACPEIPTYKRGSKNNNGAMGRTRTNIHPTKECNVRQIPPANTQPTEKRNNGTISFGAKLTSRTLPTWILRRRTPKGHIYGKYDRSGNTKGTAKKPSPQKKLSNWP